MPVLSVIVPLYRASTERYREYFVELLVSVSESLEASGIQKDLAEIILVNDCPEDRQGCEDLLASFALHGTAFSMRLVHNDNNIGQDASRNRGAMLASGAFLHFIDQDDLVRGAFYSCLAKPACADFVLANAMVLHEGICKPFYRSSFIRLCRRSGRIDDVFPIMANNIAISPGQYLVRRELFLCSGGFPVLSAKGCDDYGFLFNLCRYSRKTESVTMSFREDVCFVYRLHAVQNRKQLDMNKSLAEYLGSIEGQLDPMMRLVVFVRRSWISKITYSIFFHRIGRS